MKRPLFAAALGLVLLVSPGTVTGEADRTKPGFIRAEALPPGEPVLVTGQIYQKDDSSIYIKSVIILEPTLLSQPWESDILSGQALTSGPPDANQEILSQQNSDQENYNQQNYNQGNYSQQNSYHEIPCQDFLIWETEQAEELPLGSKVMLEGVFTPFSHATNPGEFDSAGYYRTLGIGGKLRKAELLGCSRSCWPLREGLYRLKCFLKKRLYRILPGEEAAVMSALLLGDKKEMDSGTKELYKRNGILHILSISSLHITIIGMSVYKLLRKVGGSVFPAALGGSVLLLLYGSLTGFGVSACRAVGMYLIKMLGEITGRTYDMLTALAVVGAGMVLSNPGYLQSSGFLLSFASVLGIGILYPALMPEPSGRPVAGKAGACLYQSFFVSMSITLTTLPVQLWFYYEIPVYSVLLNLFVIPLMKPMMIAGLLAMCVPGLSWLSILNYVILQGYSFLCGCFDRLPFHTWNPGRPEAWQIGVYYGLLLTAAAWGYYGKKRGEKKEKDIKTGKRSNGRKWREGAARAGILCLAVWQLGWGHPPENSVTFLDVGQGDCILVRTSSGQNYLFDCGSTSRSKVGKYVLLPYLKYYGIQTIDGLFLSHPDADHINGAVELLELGGENHITIRQMILPAIEKQAREEQFCSLLEAAENASQNSPVEVRYLSAGESWDCGGAVFTCLHPERNYTGENINAYSECFYVEFREEKGWNMLLTGDVESKGEEALYEELKRRQIMDISVLKAAHHGSRNSTSEELLALLAPELTVISSGRDNRYGHPHKELLERLEASGTYIVQTARSGAVTVTGRGGKIRIRVYGLP